jgi:hypothetical protein
MRRFSRIHVFSNSRLHGEAFSEKMYHIGRPKGNRFRFDRKCLCGAMPIRSLLIPELTARIGWLACSAWSGRITSGTAPLKEMKMGHIIRIQNREQLIAAIGVLDELPGMWHARGTPEAPILLVTDAQYKALVNAGVAPANGKEGKTRDKKATAKKAKP